MTLLAHPTLSAARTSSGASLPAAELRAASLLAPVLFPTYQRIMEYLAASHDLTASLTADAQLSDLMSGNGAQTVDLAFLCGLQYVRLVETAQREGAAPRFEPLAAPVLPDARYQGQPVYFSDIVVRRASRYTCLGDLAGTRFVYNERTSHSGYVVVRYSLLKEGSAPAFFGEWAPTGAHSRSLEAVASGDADATAIDSHVLAILLRNDAALSQRVRIIGSFGPSTMPPLVVRSDMDPHLKRRLRQLLLLMHEHPTMREHLRAGHIERFVAVDDVRYDDIRRMHAVVMAQHETDA